MLGEAKLSCGYQNPLYLVPDYKVRQGESSWLQEGQEGQVGQEGQTSDPRG